MWRGGPSTKGGGGGATSVWREELHRKAKEELLFSPKRERFGREREF